LAFFGVFLASCEKTAIPPGWSTPEDALRELFLAMLTGDQAKLTRSIVPDPNAAILRGHPPMRPAEFDAAKASIQRMEFRRIGAGEHMTLPNGKTIAIEANMLGPDRYLILPMVDGKPTPTPLWVLRVEGTWHVDAGPLIGARRAAQQAGARPGP
jgi:hypothetical protein